MEGVEVGRVAEGIVDGIVSGDAGGNGPSESEERTWGGKREVSELENSTKGQGPGPSAPLLGHRRVGGREE